MKTFVKAVGLGCGMVTGAAGLATITYVFYLYGKHVGKNETLKTITKQLEDLRDEVLGMNTGKKDGTTNTSEDV